MSNLTKLAATSLVHVWPAVLLTSAGSHVRLQLVFRVSVLFWSRRFSSPERFGAIVFNHSPTPTFIILHFTDLISLDGCLEWALMAGLRGFAAMGAVFYLDTPGTHLPFKRGSG